MADAQKRIEIVTEFFTKGLDTQYKAQQAVGGLEQMLSKVGKTMQTTQMAQNNVTKAIEKQGKLTQKSTSITKKFDSSTLSLMFTAMMLNRVFSSLTASSYEMWGINEMLSAAIDVVMIPAMASLLPIIISVSQWFMNLSDTAKSIIGWTAIIGGALTGVGVFLATLNLGIQGAIDIFSRFITKAPAVALAEGEVAAATGATTAAFSALNFAIGLGIAVGVIGAIYLLVKAFGALKSTTPQFIIDANNQIDKLNSMADAAKKAGDMIGYLAYQNASMAEGINLLQKTSGSGLFGGAVSRQDLAPTIKGAQNATIPSDLSGFSITQPTALNGLAGLADPNLLLKGSNGNSNLYNITASYNVNVADKATFEQMLKENNTKLTEDIRRISPR